MNSKSQPKGNPQAGGSGSNPRTTRTQAKAAQKGASTLAAAKDNVPPADPMTGTDPAAKVPSIREQLTSAYEAKVAETKATRDPRLLKKKGNLKKKNNLMLIYLHTYHLPLTFTYHCSPGTLRGPRTVSYTHLTLPTIYSV